jgi:hypothetical protein
MNNIVSTSQILPELFPAVYQEEAPTLIAFLQTYYNWLETSDYGQSKNLLSYRDIDRTLDDFIIFFKNEYLANLPLITQGNIRTFIKHANDFYSVRGTDAGIKLLFNLLYDTQSKVYRPSQDIFKLSDGEWYRPTYLEVSLSNRTKAFFNTTITGGTSGATAYVETIVRKIANGQYYDVLYLSNINGNFITGEIITNDNNLVLAPLVVGSLNTVTIVDGGQNSSIGDLFDVVSNTGKHGIARVSNTVNGSGRVAFTLDDGGSGISLTANCLISDKILNVTNITNSNSANNFTTFEQIEQNLNNIIFVNANSQFTVGDTVVGYSAGTFTNQGSGTIMSVSQAGSNGSILVNFSNNQTIFSFANIIRKSGNTISANIVSVSNNSVLSNLLGVTANSIGVFGTNGTFYVNGKVRGVSSNTYATISSISLGSNAAFTVGSINNTETILTYSDILSGNNSAGTPYQYIVLDCSGSGIGKLASITIAAGGTIYANGASLVVTGGGNQVNNTIITAGGTNYANGERLIFTGITGTTPVAAVSTNSTGGITGFTYLSNGTFLSSTPTVTVNTAIGTGANISVVLTPAANVIIGTVSTNSTGGITGTATTFNGNNYYSIPTITVSGGAGANLQPTMLFGYGFPKNPWANSNSIIESVLTQEILTIGSVTSLSGLAPGLNYNQNPFALINEPTIASYNYNTDLAVLNTIVGSYMTNEIVTQNQTLPLNQLTFTGISGNVGFEVNEVVTQGAANGIVYYKDASVVRLTNVNGTFVNTTGVPTQITGLVTGATANVSNVALYTQNLVFKGTVLNQTANTVEIKRLTFDIDLSTNNTLIGATTGATGNVISFSTNTISNIMGNNAILETIVRTANGITSELQVIDSGYGFRSNDSVILTNSNNITLTGVAGLHKQGQGQGFWKSTKGFLDSDKYIFDSYYYQQFSYEIQTSLSFDYYADLVKAILHNSGSIMFGKVIIESQTTLTELISDSSIVQT